ncbi:copper homeostasis/adhesion lipoprotein NlpE [Salmonella enterica subsp. enterica]|nr:copper homeostasis/adhesion lipoprotein NlpE [Salmonella enterica subsp. enterica serovar Typhisuis]EBY0743625.1 copper homeostasis/adhesion lipoprotein NlpE [Salmonella enterica subsp. enterica serovar Typhisuis]ECA6060685.1 envelope stress response activation lipoprotein NlpE [Salmonella enterica subsp. enterica serovar Typhisuis]HDI5730032.1 envelope stress response activation lipoprotein NlpE [Salmonella enterica subsp. enterica serovar Typhisuis]
MVRTAILSVAAACTLFALIGCNNRAEVDALQPAQAAELKPMQQSWRGVLPCADCEGIETSLFLEKDGTWVMNERYQGVREEPSSFASYGTWARTADKLVLTDSNGEKSYYRAKGNALEMLDREGNPVASQLNYTLVPVTASLPVASNAQLERGYLAAKGEAEKPVLLTVEGHFVLAANPDTGEPVKTLIADKNVKFAPGKDCTH